MKTIKPMFKIETPMDKDFILKHIERSARTCYKSEGKMGESYNENFLRNIIKSGHESVLEHFSFSVRFIVDRGVTHELVRHRIASFSQESTRYVNYNNNFEVIDIKNAINLDTKMQGLSIHLVNEILNEWALAMQDAEAHYTRMIQLGATPQMARSVLPNSVKTEIVVTANLREWRHILKLRTSKAAHPQIREIMIPLLKELQEQLPIIFDDITVE